VGYFDLSGRVAIVTARRLEYSGYFEDFRIRAWQTADGRLINEYRAYERSAGRLVFGLLWSAEGRYLLAANQDEGFTSTSAISLWNADSGRHRGEFTGFSNGNISGVFLLPGGKKLVAGCYDGKIRFWDFAAAAKAVEDFERSLTTN